MSERLRIEIDKERKRLSALAASVEPRVLALTILRLADQAFLGDQEDAGLAKAYAMAGAPTLFRLVPAAALKAPGWPIFVTDAQLARNVWALTARAAIVSVCERAIVLARGGLGTVYEDGDIVRIAYDWTGHDLEREDRADGDLARAEVLRTDDEDSRESLELAAVAGAMHSKAASLAGRWMTDYIQYDSDPDVEDYFHRLAVLRCKYRLGMHDSFEAHATFGDVPFEVYRAVVGTLVGFSLHHVACASALLRREQGMQASNVMTIVSDHPRLTTDLDDAFDGEVTREAISQALEMLTYRADADLDLLAPGECFAPLVEIGDGFVVRSLQGSLGNPFWYLLKKLRARFRSDWDREQNRREAYFRREINSLFPRDRFRTASTPGLLRVGRDPLTDIDAAVVDVPERTLGLFQLKWQDPFGLSPTERRSRATNFVRASNEWVVRVNGWIEQHGIEGVQRALRLPRERIDRVRLFVLAREHANFSGSFSYDPGAAWANWFQFVTAVRTPENSGLAAIHSNLQAEFIRRRSSMSEPTSQELRLGDLGVRIEVGPPSGG